MPYLIIHCNFTKQDIGTLAMALNVKDPLVGESDNRAADDISVDADWYKERYPDVAEAGVDPAEHYLVHGRSEGRFPNPEAELATMGEVINDDWYRARYPDVAAAGGDPVRHYLLYGRAEGRYPNVDCEPRCIWDTCFDPIWYRARNTDLGFHWDDPLEHFRRIGILEGRAPNSAEENREAWREIFDPDWYLARNPDVARRGLDPIEHFITEGLIDRRRPNPHAILESEPVTAAKIDLLKVGAFADEVALFVTHASDGAIKPHVSHHVASLRGCGIACFLIVACDDVDVAVTGAALDQVDHVIRRANAGFDFAAWAHVLRLQPEIFNAKILYLVNDSIFGPTHREALERVVARIRASKADLVGLTDSADRGWHIQSYFLAMKQPFLASEAGQAFFDSVVSYAHKNDVVNEYETQLARYATARGFRAEVLFPTPEWLDATLHNWRKLLRAGFPYLKVGTARALVPTVETADWRAEMTARGYDTGPADRTLARLARDVAGGRAASEGIGRNENHSVLAEMHEFLAIGDVLDLSPGAVPLVSFLAVLDGRPAWLLRIMRALAHGQMASSDVVIIDNASIDDTHHILGQLIGATIVTNVAPLPPLRTALQAFVRARSDVLVFVRPGAWHFDEPSHSIADGSEDGQALLNALKRVCPAGDGLTFQIMNSPIGSPWRAFGLYHRGDFLGAAYAMLRRDMTESPETLICLLDPQWKNDTSDPCVL